MRNSLSAQVVRTRLNWAPLLPLPLLFLPHLWEMSDFISRGSACCGGAVVCDSVEQVLGHAGDARAHCGGEIHDPITIGAASGDPSDPTAALGGDV